LLDEPFTAIDAETTAKLIQLLLEWHKEGRTIVCALHDLLLIKKYFPDSFVLAGKCLGRGHTHDLFEQKLLSFNLDMAELYTNKTEAEKAHHDHHA
jgi:zinc/manganese transport system ATP-binding protein